MSKLLRAYFIRLGKWNIYWILMAFMFVCGVVGTLLFGKQIAFQIPYTISCLIFPQYIGLVIGLFNYPSFTNGTIKNQIVVGHSRNNIFIANFFKFLF